jgi:predicted HAD superfamily Cof-like phosphohydrolase
VYVAYGTAWSYGIDLDAVIDEIHASNMSKLDDDGNPIYRKDGKVLKGPSYFPPDLKEVLWPSESDTVPPTDE